MNKLGTIANKELERFKDVAVSAIVLGIALLLLESPAFASSGGAGGSMPWEMIDTSQIKSYTHLNYIKWQQ